MNRNSLAAGVVSASGIEVASASGQTALDLTAAMASCLGHRHPAVIEAVQSAAESHLGCGPPLPTANLAGPLPGTIDPSSLGGPFPDFAAVWLQPSAAEANELAIRIARSSPRENRGDGRADPSTPDLPYRIITLLGADHGDTLACRSAGGRFAAQLDLGPLAAGFRHVAPGDLRGLEKAIDGQTAAIMLAPVDWSRGGISLDAAYFDQIRQLCDAHRLWLIVDETRLPAAISGEWFYHQSQGWSADLVTASAGWTGGLPGGLVLASAALAQQLPGVADGKPSTDAQAADYPLLSQVVAATAATVAALGGPRSADQLAADWSQRLGELVTGFEFVADVSTVGLGTILRFDIAAAEVVDACAGVGLRMIATDETTALICLPLTVTTDQIDTILNRLAQGLESIERETIES